MSYTAKYLSALSQIDAEVWDNIAVHATPFMQHAFLSALEKSRCVQAETGWQPHHMIVSKGDRPVAVLPLYIKHHSYGEYVFDSEWAKAYQRFGVPYYPKLLSSVPFTPVTGPRLAILKTESQARVHRYVVDEIQTLCQATGYSSWHCLFTPASDIEWWGSNHLIRRNGVQFHWVNKGYESFDHYLSTMNAKRRKTIRRERRQIKEQGIAYRFITAREMSSSNWLDFYRCYTDTYLKRGQAPYLNLDFFQQIAAAMPEQMLCLMAEQNSGVIACALFFIGGSTLYGRYWGSVKAIQCLHFETCYYQGIEYAINHGLEYFDAGAQGEHKISRGFEPIKTCSWHWIQVPEFRAAIAQYTAHETQLIEQYQVDCAASLPFKAGLESFNNSVDEG